MLDKSHAATATSWVASANGHAQFPIQNLPMGVFCPQGGSARIGVAIGDQILDVRAAMGLGLFDAVSAPAREALEGSKLNEWMALPSDARTAARHAFFDVLDATHAHHALHADVILHSAVDCVMQMPCDVGDFTDFYAGIHHATQVGKIFRPDNPLMPNYKHVPIAYHGRASSLVPSGTAVRRPSGQVKTDSAAPAAVFMPSAKLDFELELGIWVGSGNALGTPIPLGEAAQHIAGYGLLNDWSARDIQAWEYQPLGPFQGKNFASSVSCWVVMADALAPFRAAAMERDPADPRPMPYLHDEQDQRAGGLAIELEVWLSTAAMREQGLAASRLSVSDTRHLYWTPAQMVTQHTSGGCNLRPGDLLGTGTISTPDEKGYGSLLEMTHAGTRPLSLPSGESRVFLQAGDEVTLRAQCRRDGFVSIGFGECRARIVD